MIDFHEVLTKTANPLVVIILMTALPVFPGCAPKVDEGRLFDTMEKGLVLGDRGKNDEAMEEFGRAIEMVPDLWDAHYEMGNALARNGRDPEAVLEYRRTIELNPEYSPVYRKMGKVLKRMGYPEAALENYNLAFDHLTEDERGTLQHVMMLREKGELLRLTDRCNEALEAYGQALEMMPRYPRALVEAAWCLGETGEVEKSARVYRRALELSPKMMIGVAADGELQMLQEMAAQGGDIHIRGGRKDQYTPLMAAVAGGHRNVVSWLLVNGADPNIENDCGTTALLVAVRTGNAEMAEILMNYGADTEAADCFGTSAADLSFLNRIE
jgi:tetratricopeptide (TPR) repeat protein